MQARSDGSEVFPEPGEEAIAAETKRAADLSRLPAGTQVRLRLRDGEVRTGPKGDFGAEGIEIDGYDRTPFDQVVDFEAGLGAKASPDGKA